MLEIKSKLRILSCKVWMVCPLPTFQALYLPFSLLLICPTHSRLLSVLRTESLIWPQGLCIHVFSGQDAILPDFLKVGHLLVKSHLNVTSENPFPTIMSELVSLFTSFTFHDGTLFYFLCRNYHELKLHHLFVCLLS